MGNRHATSSQKPKKFKFCVCACMFPRDSDDTVSIGYAPIGHGPDRNRPFCLCIDPMVEDDGNSIEYEIYAYQEDLRRAGLGHRLQAHGERTSRAPDDHCGSSEPKNQDQSEIFRHQREMDEDQNVHATSTDPKESIEILRRHPDLDEVSLCSLASLFSLEDLPKIDFYPSSPPTTMPKESNSVAAHPSELSEYEQVDCLACGLLFIPTECYELCKNQHYVCKDSCYESFITSALNDGISCVPIRCPIDQCGKVLKEDLLAKLMTEDQMEMYTRLCLMRKSVTQKKSQETAVCCPSCGYIEYRDVSNEQIMFVYCKNPECLKISCYTCKKTVLDQNELEESSIDDDISLHEADDLEALFMQDNETLTEPSNDPKNERIIGMPEESEAVKADVEVSSKETESTGYGSAQEAQEKVANQASNDTKTQQAGGEQDPDKQLLPDDDKSSEDEEIASRFAYHMKCHEFRVLKQEFERLLELGHGGACPTCHLVGTKNAGECCHMTCPNCATEWCYMCGKSQDQFGGNFQEHFMNPEKEEATENHCYMYFSHLYEVAGENENSAYHDLFDENFDPQLALEHDEEWFDELELSISEVYYREKSLKLLKEFYQKIGQESFENLFKHFPTLRNCGYSTDEISSYGVQKSTNV